MIDGFKCSCFGLDSSIWKNNKRLAFVLPVCPDTGEVVRQRVEAQYNGLTFAVSPASNGGETCSISGSLHTYKNKGAHNYDNFTLSEIRDTLDGLETDFNVKMDSAPLHGLEVGFNLSCKPQPVIKSAICYKGTPFESIVSRFKGNGVVCRYSDFDIKLYDKNKQFPFIKIPTLRVELKIKRSRPLHDCGITTLSDLKRGECIAKLVSLLVDKIRDCVFFDYQAKPIGVTANQLLIWQRFSNPNYWNGLSRNMRYKAKKRYSELMEKYGAKDFGVMLVGMIQGKSSELLQSKQIKGLRFPHSDGNSESTKRVTFSDFKYLCTNVTSKGGGEATPVEQSEEMKNTDKRRYCKCCGRDITHQRKDSVFCSEKYFGKEAKKCRNKDSNRRMIIKRKIKNAMEKEKMMQVVYVDSNGLEYSDILEAREINVSREWLERVKSVSVLDGTEETQTGENAKEYISKLMCNNKKERL